MLKVKKLMWVLSLLFLVLSGEAVALSYSLPPSGDSIVGKIQIAIVQPGENFAAVARRFDIGYCELVEANPNVNPDAPPEGSVLIVPTQYILPNVQRAGVVINLVEMRLYYYPHNKNVVHIFPVGIGREGWETPLGFLKVIEHIPQPIWHAPESIRASRSKEGVFIPKVVFPGPDNPLGDYALRLSNTTYLIHGTNDPSGVGRRSSAGCIRMYPEDIKKLFSMATNGTPVHIINHPYKAGWQGNHLYLEVHLPLQGDNSAMSEEAKTPETVIKAAITNNDYVNWKKALDIAKEQQGMPQVIGKVTQVAGTFD